MGLFGGGSSGGGSSLRQAAAEKIVAKNADEAGMEPGKREFKRGGGTIKPNQTFRMKGDKKK